MGHPFLDTPFWLVNFFLVLIAFVYVLRQKSTAHVLIGLLGYLTFHHSYGVLPLFLGYSLSGASILRSYHGIYPQLIGAVFLLFCVIWIAWRTYQNRLPIAHYRSSYPIVLIGLVWAVFGLVVIGSDLLAGSAFPTMLVIKDYLSAVLMILLAVTVGYGLRTETERNVVTLIPFGFILVAVFVVVAVGAYEVLSEQAWSGQYLADGVRSNRASSVLFNPNVLGIWAALLALGSCYLWIAMPNHLIMSLLITSLSVTGLFLSGSRSALLLYYASMVIFGVLLWVRRLHLRRFFISVTVFSLLFAVIVAGCYQYSYDQRGHPLRLLSDRFIVLTELIGRSAEPNAETDGHKSETAYSGVVIGIAGRIGGEISENDYLANSDNGYLAIKEGLGLGPMLVWVGLLIAALVAGLRLYFRQVSLFGAFALTCLMTVVLMGMIIRAYQVFPIWGFNAIFMGLFLFWLMSGDDARAT